MNGIQEITQERIEQIEKHGRTVERDVKNNTYGQLVEAACLLTNRVTVSLTGRHVYPCPHDWDVDTWVSMCRKPYRQRLIIAGALLAAEIDRLDYIEQQKEKA